MRTDIEKEYLIKAIDSFKRSLIIISPDFRIIASNHDPISPKKPDIVGQLCHQALYNRNSPCKDCLALEVLETHKSAIRKGQEGIMALQKVSCLFSYPIIENGEIKSLVILDFAVSTMARMEERLLRSNGMLSNLIGSAVDGIIAADSKGKILVFNDAACKITGHTIEDVYEKLDIRDIYPGDGAREVMHMLRSDEYGGKGKLKSYKVDILKKNGKTIPISLNAAIVYQGNEITATLGFFHDLRESMKIEEELKKIQVQLLQAEKMSSLGKMAAGVAHQLNNPLGGITLFAQLALEEYELPDGARKDIQRILNDAKRCSNIVKELLEFSRQTSNDMRPHNVNKAISQTLFLLENQTLFHDINIVKEFDMMLPPVHVDIQQINHVFMNIILNAADAMEGKGELKVKTILSEDNDRVRIEISDTGPGIPQDILSKIFDPFFTTKTQGKGTGLGLSLAYSIIENHGGQISAESELGRGTTFIIELSISPNSNIMVTEEGIIEGN